MKKNYFLLAALLIGSVAIAKADNSLLQQDMFCNYGWVNLTAGYTRDATDGDPIKSEIMVSGRTVHVVWADRKSNSEAQPEGYDVWYRRSLDGGATWEDARSIYKRRAEDWNGYYNIMQVVGDNVHILVPDNTDNDNADDSNPRLVYLRSTDGGATFTQTVLGEGPWYYYGFQSAVIRAEGQNVVIAYFITTSGNPDVVVCRSQDNGENFNKLTVTFPKNLTLLGDLQLSGDRWAVLTRYEDWYSGLIEGRVYVATGDMQSSEYNITDISPELSDGRHLCQLQKQSGYNGDDLNYHPLMAIVGEQIHVLFTGANEITTAEDGSEEANYNQTLYVRSDDFGKTWQPVVKIPDTDWSHNMLVAKGRNVYAIVGSGYNRWIAYSNDGGDTWKQNKQMCYGTTCSYYGCNNYDSPRAYSLVIDPNDATGATAWYIGDKMLQVQTKDGFNSLSYYNRADGELHFNGRYSQFSPVLAIDSEGFNHWLMRNTVREGEGQAFQIYYRKDSGEPAPSDKNMALHVVEQDGMTINNRVAIPQRESLHIDSALTVGCWVRFDNFKADASIVSLAVNTPEMSGDLQLGGPYYSVPGFSLGFGHVDAYDAEKQDWIVQRAAPKAYIQTDKSEDGNGTTLIVWSPYDEDAYMAPVDGIWHYVAFTWDGRQLKDNFRLYLDGMPLTQATVFGAIPQGTNPIIIGNSNYNTDGTDLDWWMDELRIWNRALSFDEIKALCHHKEVSMDGCIVSYGFDGTLKDLSGNGNDAVAQLNCDLVEYEGLQLPEPKMQLAKDWTGSLVTYTDQTENGEAVYWYYDIPGYSLGTGNSGTTSRHTQRQFSLPWEAGITHPIMIARGGNACAPAYGEIAIGGLNKIEPSVAGQAENVKLKIYGGYIWKSDLNVRLHREGQQDIIGSWVKREGYSDDATNLEKLPYAMFDLSNAETGEWDVIVGTDTLFSSLTVEQFEEPDVWAEVTGWDRMLTNRAKNFYIEYGNRANVDAYNVPFYLFINDNADVTLGFENPLYPESLDDAEMRKALDEIGHYVVFDAGKYGQMRCYSFIIPRIAANSRSSQMFVVKSSSDVNMSWLISSPWGPLEYDENGNPMMADDGSQNAPHRMPQGKFGGGAQRFSNDQIECMMNYLGWGVMDATMSSIPFVGCAYGIGKTGLMGLTDKPQDRWGNLFTNVLTTGFSCLMDFNPLGWAWRATTLASFAFSTAMNIYSAKGCTDGDGGNKDVNAVGSYDPNEMIGPSGYGDEHFIKPAPEMSYTVTFENKSTATAPAHEVFVTDTLDANIYDFASFGFTSFGWADTTLRVEGQMMKEFVQDVDMRPKQDLIVRVNGKFNVEKGIAQWSFISLNPETKEYEEDPDKGFLVPNNANHEGEGFVSFGINHKTELGNGQKIENEAVIVFDANEAIKTNRFSNTLDADLPESKAITVSLVNDSLLVDWTESDATSGVRSVQVFVSVNDSAFVPVEGNKLHYDAINTYCFATIAVDNVGWREAKTESDLTCEASYVPTAIIMPEADTQNNTYKFIRNGHLYIINNGKTYNANGLEIK